jgi:hypothetical protein
MADSKISALPASTTPLAGTEVLPIVQSSTTKQVSVANLTGGRSFDALRMTWTSTDAGASAAPLLDLYRDSATPAASDTLGEIEFNGEDSAGNKQQYAVIHASILSPTSTAETGQIHFETATGGASTEKMIIGSSNLVINDIGAIYNVRIEGDTDANLFYTDATNSRVGIGTISPATKLDVNGTITSTALVTTGSLTTSTTAGIIGTTTNNDANAGSVGEFITGGFAAFSVGTGIANVGSISLSPGDWDVVAVASSAGIPVGCTAWKMGISTTSGAYNDFGRDSAWFALDTVNGVGGGTIPTVRISSSSTSTVYLVMNAIAAIGSQVYASISARRRR